MERKIYQSFCKHIILKYACEQFKYSRNINENTDETLGSSREVFILLFLLFLCSTDSKISGPNNVDT